MKKIDWTAVKANYFYDNLKLNKSKAFTLKELSVRWKIAYKTIRNRSSAEGWNDDLLKCIADQQVEVLLRVRDEHIEAEVVVRQRQAQIARYLTDKALRRIVTFVPEDLSKKEAVELIKLGLGEERRALGLPERYEVNASMDIKDSGLLVEQMAQHQLGEALFARLLDALPHEASESSAVNCTVSDK